MGWADIGPLLQPDLPNTQFVFPTAPVVSPHAAFRKPPHHVLCCHRYQPGATLLVAEFSSGLRSPLCCMQRSITLNDGMRMTGRPRPTVPRNNVFCFYM